MNWTRGEIVVAMRTAALCVVACAGACAWEGDGGSSLRRPPSPGFMLVRIKVSPSAATIPVGGSLQLAAEVLNALDPTVAWTASAGSITANGLFTAPATAGVVQVTATSHADPRKAATARVTIDGPPTAAALVAIAPADCVDLGDPFCVPQGGGGTTCTDRCLRLHSRPGASLGCSAAGSQDPNGEAVSYAYEWTLSGTSVVVPGASLPAGWTHAGETWRCSVTPTAGALSGPPATAEVVVGTVVPSQVLATDTTWAVPGSAYFLDGLVSIDFPATLSLGPGVAVIGGSLRVFGTLAASGSADDPVRFSGVAVMANGMTPDRPHRIDLARVRLEGGTLYAPMGDAMYGSLTVRDSRITRPWRELYVWYPTDSYIERNVLEDVDISAGTDAAGTVYVRNNAFVGASRVESWAAYGNPVVVAGNTFWNAGAVVAGLKPGYSPAQLDARGNYWGGVADADVPSMILDHADDPACVGTIPFLPTLAAPDPATPIP